MVPATKKPTINLGLTARVSGQWMAAAAEEIHKLQITDWGSVLLLRLINHLKLKQIDTGQERDKGHDTSQL